MKYNFPLIKEKLLKYLLSEISVDKDQAKKFINTTPVLSNGANIYLYSVNILNARLTGLDIYDHLRTLEYHYNSKTHLTGNWWEWRIGIPYNYLLLELLLPAPTKNCENTVKKFVRNYAKWSDLTYANLASICKNLFLLGVLTLKSKYIDEALKYSKKAFAKAKPRKVKFALKLQEFCIKHQWFLHPTWFFAGKEGLYDDGTFLQHTSIPYIGTYGKEIIQYAALLLACDIELPNAITSVLPDWIKAYELALYDNQVLLMYCGRSVNNIDPFAAGQTLQRYVSEVKSKLNITTEYSDQFFCYQKNAARVIYLQPKFRFCVLLYSNSVAPYEAFSGDNYPGGNESLGLTFLYLPGDKNYSYGYYDRVGYDSIPGTLEIGPVIHESKHPLFTYTKSDLENTEIELYKVYYNNIMYFKYKHAKLGLVEKYWYFNGNEITCKGTMEQYAKCVVDDRYNAELVQIIDDVILDKTNNIEYHGDLEFEGTKIRTKLEKEYSYTIKIL